MKNIIVTIVCIFVLTMASSSIVHNNEIKNKNISTPQQEILGVWFLENSPSDKIEFLANGQVKKYVDDVLQYTDTYQITNSCGGENSTDQLFLKIIDSEDSDEYCFYINGINENNNNLMSLTPNGSMKLLIYVR